MSGIVVLLLAVLAVGSSEDSSSPEQRASEAERRAKAQERAAERHSRQENFKQWALESTAVTDIAFAGDHTFFVTLKGSKYTSKANVQSIAEYLARACASQTGVSFATCKVYRGRTLYAQGDFGK